MALGKLVMLLLNLECLVRANLVILRPELKGRWGWAQIVPGGEVVEDAFTAYEGFDATLRRYNGVVAVSHRLDREALVGLRDMLAHGRIIGQGPTSFPFVIVKFGKDKGRGTIPVEAVVEMTLEWFAAQDVAVRKAVKQLDAAVRAKRGTDRPSEGGGVV